jgi:hypothetical protein
MSEDLGTVGLGTVTTKALQSAIDLRMTLPGTHSILGEYESKPFLFMYPENNQRTSCILCEQQD